MSTIRGHAVKEMATNGTDARPLFGGSFSIVLPPHFTDVSDIRDVPDNQEVFVHNSTEQSIIVELLEYQSQVADEEAARYHFDDVTAINDASGKEGTEVLSVEPVSRDQLAMQELSSAWFLSGRQQVAKFNEQAKNTVNVHLALFRLRQYTTDILITFNDPTTISPFSSSSRQADLALPEDLSASPAAQHWTLEQFRATVNSLRLLNPAIFS
ncbi:ran guanine nucleotide release factor isoform X1 [Mobula hypostoma]|uniref:ran guanine nucleotide release factor isoform X1 n=2 Tax=Mobula hypostoma TaxID=723540 RepID=UPI002FC2FB76